jgi:protein-serine/threonine kinase
LDAWGCVGPPGYQVGKSVSPIVSLGAHLTDIDVVDILLTVNPFQEPGEIDVNALPQPLVKLTDFGLARFINPTNPMLATRCGSESYAAPEIVTGFKYDGRKTDAWACGVVLYALATRALPFDRKVSSLASSHGHGGADGAGETRRSYLVRIAQGVYTWPEPETSGGRLSTEGVQKVVGRLLVRDPVKRAWIWDIWDEEWMDGKGAVVPPKTVVESRRTSQDTIEQTGEAGETTLDGGANVEGMLVDQHNIGSVASQELL